MAKIRNLILLTVLLLTFTATIQAQQNRQRAQIGEAFTGSFVSGEASVSFVAGPNRTFVLDIQAGNDVDSYVEVVDSNGNYIGYDDDSGEDYSPRLIFTTTIDGEYTFNIGNYSNDSGSFTLNIQELETTPIEYDQPIDVELAGSDARYFTFAGSIGDLVKITADSGAQVDTTLSLQGPKNNQLARNDDSSTIDPAIENVLLAEDGTYMIILTPFGGGDVQGTVTLALEHGITLSLDTGAQSLKLTGTTEVVSFNAVAGTRYRLSVIKEAGDTNDMFITINQANSSIGSANLTNIDGLTLDFAMEQGGLTFIEFENYSYGDGGARILVSLQPLVDE